MLTSDDDLGALAAKMDKLQIPDSAAIIRRYVAKSRLRGVNLYPPGAASPTPCQKCGEEVFEFSIPNRLWNRVVRLDGHEQEQEWLCIRCFYDMAFEQLALADKQLAERTAERDGLAAQVENGKSLARELTDSTLEEMRLIWGNTNTNVIAQKRDVVLSAPPSAAERVRRLEKFVSWFRKFHALDPYGKEQGNA